MLERFSVVVGSHVLSLVLRLVLRLVLQLIRLVLQLSIKTFHRKTQTSKQVNATTIIKEGGKLRKQSSSLILFFQI